MMRRGLDFEVDKITKSIEEIATGISYPTEVQLITPSELKKIHKKDGWNFNWKKEYKLKNREIYKLTIKGTDIIQGLISIEVIPNEYYIEMHLIESAPHNQGRNKMFFGVAPNMVAYICKMSFEAGYDGCVAFLAKTSLVEHYREKFGATLIFGSQRMSIVGPAAKKLVDSYYQSI